MPRPVLMASRTRACPLSCPGAAIIHRYRPLRFTGFCKVRDPFQSNRKRRRGLRLIEVDAWVDSSLFRVGRVIAGQFEAVSLFMRRFRVTGFNRVVVELLGDGLTLGAGGAGADAGPRASRLSRDATDWRAQGDLAVTFLDRYGNEIGKRGIKQSDAVPLDEMPDHLIKAVLATEDRRFFDHFGIDVLGHAPRAGREPARQRRRPGRLVAHPAARQEPVPVQRAHARAQDQGGLPRAVAGGQPVQEARSSSSISTAPIWAAAISASRRRRSSISASR